MKFPFDDKIHLCVFTIWFHPMFMQMLTFCKDKEYLTVLLRNSDQIGSRAWVRGVIYTYSV